jgi:Zn-dependent M28 family amino/carboxypeptidase
MQVVSASEFPTTDAERTIAAAIANISEEELREAVATLAAPRHYTAERDSNRRACEWIRSRLEGFRYVVRLDGPYDNVIALPRSADGAPLVLVGAHYDSVPGCPGADDNASAVAALLACARCVAQHAPNAAVAFAAFNREEDGLLGSTDFASRLTSNGLKIHAAHVLEMVGYRDRRPNSQRLPAGLRISIPDTGDFLGLVANAISHSSLDTVLFNARTYVPDLPVFGLKLPPGAEIAVADVLRSDHSPFWAAGIPALMWTDTAEFRNPHYHRPTDTPDTLDFDFLHSITRLLAGVVLSDQLLRSGDSDCVA